MNLLGVEILSGHYIKNVSLDSLRFNKSAWFLKKLYVTVSVAY